MRILLNFSLDASHKQSRFSKTLLKKDLEFISSRKSSIVVFDLGFVLLPAEINLIAEKQSYQGYALKVYNTNHVKIILAFLIKVLAFYISSLIT